jgi:hypothetical protein
MATVGPFKGFQYSINTEADPSLPVTNLGGCWIRLDQRSNHGTGDLSSKGLQFLAPAAVTFHLVRHELL